MMAISKVAFLAVLALSSLCGWANATYKVGVGRADITGPPVEINFVSTSMAPFKCI